MDETGRLRREVAGLRQALHDLHLYFDFADPIAPDECYSFDDPAAFNACMKRALDALRESRG